MKYSHLKFMVSASICGLMSMSSAQSAPLLKPYSFSNGGSISSSQVNADFDALYNAINNFSSSGSSGGSGSAVSAAPIVISSSGNVTVPSGASRVSVRAIGGGGGGGGGICNGSTMLSMNMGFNGYGGINVEGVFNVNPGDTMNIGIGAGGSGGSSVACGGTVSSGDGSLGGSTTVGNGSFTIVAAGGLPGSGSHTSSCTMSGMPNVLTVTQAQSSCSGGNCWAANSLMYVNGGNGSGGIGMTSCPAAGGSAGSAGLVVLQFY